MRKRMRKTEKIMEDALIRFAQGVETCEEKEVIEESLPEGGKRKTERTVRRGPMVEAVKIYYSARGKEKEPESVKLLHDVPRPEAREDE